MASIQIRRLVRHELSALRDFVVRTYGPEAEFKHKKRLRWQFVDGPFRTPSEVDPTIWVAAIGKKIVGVIGVQDGMLQLDGARIPAGWIVDVMVDPEFRGLGLSHRIHDAVRKERSILVTLTMAPATRRVAERAGCVTLGPTRQFVLPHRLGAHTVRRYLETKVESWPRMAMAFRMFNASLAGPIGIAASARALAWTTSVGRPRSALSNYDVEEVVRFPSELRSLWNQVAHRFPAVFERSVEFLNWRFCDCPELRYRRFLLRRDGELKGYLVTRLAVQAELPVGVVVDFLASPDDHSSLDALIALARDILMPDAEYLEAAASTDIFQRTLCRAGFCAARTMRPTVVCSDPVLMSRISAHAADWHFTKGDHDWDQVHPV